MDPSASFTVKIRNTAVQLIAAVVAAWLAFFVYILLFTRFAMAQFWESWAVHGGAFAKWAPVIAIALLSGTAFGLLLGAAFRKQALRVAAIAAVLLVVGDAVAMSAAPSVSAAVVSLGLLAGAFATTLARRA